MANYSGNTGRVKIAAEEVAEIVDFTISTGVATIDNSSILDGDDTHLIGSKNWSGSVNCFFDDTDATGQELMKAGLAVTLIFTPATGSAVFTGLCTIEGLEIGGARNGMVTASFTAKGNGALIET